MKLPGLHVFGLLSPFKHALDALVINQVAGRYVTMIDPEGFVLRVKADTLLRDRGLPTSGAPIHFLAILLLTLGLLCCGHGYSTGMGVSLPRVWNQLCERVEELRGKAKSLAEQGRGHGYETV